MAQTPVISSVIVLGLVTKCVPCCHGQQLLALWERMEADKARIREKKEKSAKTAKTNLAEVIGAGSPILSGAQVEWIVRHQQCCYWCEANK